MINQDLEKRSRISHLSALLRFYVKIHLKQLNKKILILKFIKISLLQKSLEFDLRMDSPNFGSIPKIVIRLFMVTNSFLPRVLIT